MSDIISKVNDYYEKFKRISDQAEKDGRLYVKEFLQVLLEHKPENVQLYDFIFMTVDDLTMDMADIYKQLLENNAALDWYTLVSFVNDEFDNQEEYYLFILECKNNGVEVHKLQEVFSTSSTLSELKEKLGLDVAKEENMEQQGEASNSNESAFMTYLREENRQLNERLDAAIKSAAEARKELKTAMEESFSNRKKALEYKVELEQLRKNSDSSNHAAKLVEIKLNKSKNMVAQLECTLDRLRTEKRICNEENQGLRDINQELSDKLSALQFERDEHHHKIEEYEKKVNEQKDTIRQLQEELEELRNRKPDISSLSTSDIHVSEIDLDMDGPSFEIPKEQYFEEAVIPEYGNDDENDYSEDDVILITDNHDEIVKHTNIFAMLIKNHQEKKFKKKTVSEQESMIFSKMMELKYSRNKLMAIKNVLLSNSALSRFELYKLISQNASDDVLSKFCGVTVTT